MAFKRLEYTRRRRKLMLFALMDMFFILLLFYLAIVHIERTKESVVSMLYATPMREYGRAQILVQIINADSLIWLDNSSFRRSGWQRNFPDNYALSVRDLPDRFREFSEVLGPCMGKDVYVVIQCPNWLDYAGLVELQTRLKEVAEMNLAGKNLRYALLPGSAMELRASHIEYDDNGDALITFSSEGD